MGTYLSISCPTAVVTLKDLNSSNPCEFPDSITDAGVIENPCNKNEILIFGGYDSNNIYIYNKHINQMKKQKIVCVLTMVADSIVQKNTWQHMLSQETPLKQS